MGASNPDADLYLVGLGMFGLRQVTVETIEILRRAKVVYHLSEKHADLCAINPNTQDLGRFYSRPGKRINIYRDMASYVVDSALEATPVVFAIDGNPMFFSDISWNIAALAKRKHIRAEALPGVSCIDVLPMQLGFEPGDLGLQIFEATQLVLYNLPVNPHLSTLILQVGYFWVRVSQPPPKRIAGAFAPLEIHLCKYFPEDHPAILIQSAYSHRSPTVVLSTELRSIDKHRNSIRPGMTLYLPRVGIPAIEATLRRQLNLP
jgi:uncharacterized protein YabN with tetrapyrrole methylase and pyrophosphatase domain